MINQKSFDEVSLTQKISEQFFDETIKQYEKNMLQNIVDRISQQYEFEEFGKNMSRNKELIAEEEAKNKWNQKILANLQNTKDHLLQEEISMRQKKVIHERLTDFIEYNQIMIAWIKSLKEKFAY